MTHAKQHRTDNRWGRKVRERRPRTERRGFGNYARLTDDIARVAGNR